MPPGGDFTLISSQGPTQLADFRGQVVLVYFGYTSCPDICPTNLGLIAEALRALDEIERGRVQVLFISVDPERDTPEHLAHYSTFFGPQFRGLTAAPEVIAEVAHRYGVLYRILKESGVESYAVDHSSYTYLIDRHGRLVERLNHASPPGEIVSRLKPWL